MEPKYLLGGTPASLAQALIADLGNGEDGAIPFTSSTMWMAPIVY